MGAENGKVCAMCSCRKMKYYSKLTFKIYNCLCRDSCLLHLKILHFEGRIGISSSYIKIQNAPSPDLFRHGTDHLSPFLSTLKVASSMRALNVFSLQLVIFTEVRGLFWRGRARLEKKRRERKKSMKWIFYCSWGSLSWFLYRFLIFICNTWTIKISEVRVKFSTF